jgi:hypothetical protein
MAMGSLSVMTHLSRDLRSTASGDQRPSDDMAG